MNNVLDLIDQAALVGERANGATNLIQCVWIYDHAIDIDGLRAFHRQLCHGRLSRRIKRSPLPFGRHRWVMPSDQSPLEIVETPRPRAEFDAWLAEQAHTPVDPEHGPGWHLALLPFTDGGAGVSLVTSHCLTDGVGLCEALADAATGRRDPISWPAAGSRGRWRAVAQDARQTVRDLPAMGRAVVAAAKFANDHRGGAGTPGTPRSRFDGPDEPATVPTATIFIDAAQWDECAHARGGTGNSLLAGLAARLAERMGRVDADGLVPLAIPVDLRTAGDTRANAITAVDVMVDPVTAPTDLRPIRAAVKRVLTRLNEIPDKRFALLPLAPLVPEWLVKRMAGAALGDETTTRASNLGAINPAVGRPDGTAADHFAIRNLFPGVTKATMHRVGGILGMLSGTVQGRVFVSVQSYQLGGVNSNDDLRHHLSGAVSDFSLTAAMDWPRVEQYAHNQ